MIVSSLSSFFYISNVIDTQSLCLRFVDEWGTSLPFWKKRMCLTWMSFLFLSPEVDVYSQERIAKNIAPMVRSLMTRRRSVGFFVLVC